VAKGGDRMGNRENYMKRLDADAMDDFLGWSKRMPFLDFRDEWQIKMIPPFGGAIVRFGVRERGCESDFVSIYLDCYDRIGLYGEPYLEVYPHDDDVFRCAMLDTESLIKAISESVKEIQC
jgi:hypothetical protein